MARVTSARDRSRGRASIPVTTTRGRRNRQAASGATVTEGRGGRPSGGTGGRVTTGGRQGGGARVTTTGGRGVTPGAGRRENVRPVSPSSTGRGLPPAGGTTGNSARAQAQAGWARDRGARNQAALTFQILGRGLARAAGIDRQSVAEARLARAARGSRGEGVRAVPPGGGNTGGRPQLPAGRNAGALPPGRQGGALATRPAGGALATRPAGGALAARGGRGGALATRPNGTPVDGRLVGVNVAEVRRRPRLEGQRALPAGQRALPPGQRGGALSGGRQGGSAAATGQGGARGSGSRPLLPGSSVRGLLPGGTGGADRVTGSGVRTGRPGANRPALPPGRPAASSAARPAASSAARPTGGSPRMGGAGITAAGALLTPLVQAAGSAAGQWLGRNVLLPLVDRYEDNTSGTQSARERRRQIVREGGRQGPPVPERLRQAPARGSNDTSRPSRSGGSNDTSRPSRSGGSNDNPPSRPQRAQAPGPVSAPVGMSGDPLQGRNGAPQPQGSPLTAEPAPLPGQRPQAPVTASSARPAAAPQRPPGTTSGSSTAAPAQSATAAPSSGQSERPAANDRLAIPSRGPTGREEMIAYNIARAKRKKKPAES